VDLRAPYDRKLTRSQKLRALGLGDYQSDTLTAAGKVTDASGAPLDPVQLGKAFSMISPRVWSDYIFGYNLQQQGSSTSVSAISVPGTGQSVLGWLGLIGSDPTFLANVQSAWADANTGQQASDSNMSKLVSDTTSALQTAAGTADSAYVSGNGFTAGGRYETLRAGVSPSQSAAYAAALTGITQALADFLTAYMRLTGAAAMVTLPLARSPAENAALDKSAIKINKLNATPNIPGAPAV